MNAHYELRHEQAAKAAILTIQNNWEAFATAKTPMVVDVSLFKKKRTVSQNSRYWSGGVLARIAEAAWVDGKQYSAEAWHEHFKRLFVGIEELPNGQVIGKSSKKLTTKEFAEFCEKVEAYAVSDLGVIFNENF